MNLFSDELISLYVQEKLHSVVHSIYKSSRYWNFRCTCCGDSKKRKRIKRGYYYKETNSYHCFNEETCGAKGLWVIVKLGHLEIDAVKQDYIAWARKYKNIPNYNTPLVVPVKEPEPKIQIPDNWVDLNEDAKKLIETRKIMEAPYIPHNWQLYYNTKTKRIVIPWIEHNEIKYYQERALYKNQEPKYLFPYGIDKYVFGLEHIDINFPYIYMLEGCFDSIFVKNAVAVGGINLTDSQQTLLNNYHCELVLFTDNPWIDPASKKKILSIKDKCKVFMWPKEIKSKDVNDYVVIHKDNPFNDDLFLANNTVSIAKAQVMLKLG